MRGLVPLLMLLAWPTVARAQDDDGASAAAAERRPARRIDLRGLLRAATRRAPALARARVDAEVARGAALEAQGIDDWVASASLRYQFSQNPTIPGQPVQTLKSETYQLSSGLAAPLPTGGVVAVELDLVQENSDLIVILNQNVPSPVGVTQFAATPRLRLDHPLLRGAGTTVSRAQRKQAEYGASAEELIQKAVAIEAVQQIADGYWGLTHAKEMLRIRKRGVELANAQLKVARTSIRSGSMPKSVARAVQHRLAVREQELLRAEVDVTERALALRRLVGLELGPGEISLDPKDDLAAADRVFELDRTLESVLASHPRLRAAEILVTSAGVGEAAAKDRMLPQLDVRTSIGPRGLGPNANEAFRQVGQFNQYEFSAQVNLQYEIPMRGARGARQQARARKQRARVDQEDLRRELTVAVVRGIDRVRAAEKQLEVAERAEELAAYNLKDEQARFRAGRTTVFEVLDRQDELQAARASVADGKLAHHQSVAAVEALTGEILDRYGVRLK